MIIIDVNSNIEKALKEYKKVIKIKQNQQLRNNQKKKNHL